MKRIVQITLVVILSTFMITTGGCDALERKPEQSHDVAVTNISAPSGCIQGDTVRVVLTVRNEGNCSETFAVTLTDTTNGSRVASKTITLSSAGEGGLDEVVDRIFDAEVDEENLFGQMVRIGGDVNRDGYDDLLIGADGYNQGQGRAYLYCGGEGMLNENADRTFTGEGKGDHLGDSGGAFGDVNGDGFDDVIIGARGYSGESNDGRVYIYHGGPDMDENADVIIDGEAGEGGYFGLMVVAGDVNNDGYDDILVTALAMYSLKGRAYLYYGGDPMDNIADKTFDGENAGDWFGRDAFMGDVDGDSCADVLIGARRWPEGTNLGRAYLYYGDPGTSMDTICDETFTGENAGDYFGHGLGIIDVDNDNFGDVLIGAYGYGSNQGRAHIYWGSSRATFENIADKTFNGEPGDAKGFFGVDSGVGYVNDDDYGDILIGAYLYQNNDKRGRVYLYYGGAKTSTDVTCDHTFTGSDLNSRYGVEAELGDLNNDGFADVVIGGWSYNNNRGRVWLYYNKPPSSTKVNFDWNTNSASVSEHTLKAEIVPVAGEDDTADNTMTATVNIKSKVKEK